MKTIDIHTHGISGYDTHAGSVSGILEIASMHGISGVSEIILSVYPSELDVMRQEMAVILQAIDIQKKELDMAEGNYKPRAGTQQAKIIGIHLEGPFLNKSRCGALNPDSLLEPSEYSLKKLIEGFEMLVKIVTIAPELNGALNIIRKISDMGIIASMGHSEATYNEAEEGYNCGAKGVTHIFNAMCGFHHREPGIAGFGLLNRHIYSEVIADPYHLHPATLEMIFRVKNPERIIIVSDTVRDSGLRSPQMAITDVSGRLAGGSMTITESAAQLIERGFEKEKIEKCITENPFRFLMG